MFTMIPLGTHFGSVLLYSLVIGWSILFPLVSIDDAAMAASYPLTVLMSSLWYFQNNWNNHFFTMRLNMFCYHVSPLSRGTNTVVQIASLQGRGSEDRLRCIVCRATVSTSSVCMCVRGYLWPFSTRVKSHSFCDFLLRANVDREPPNTHTLGHLA